MTSFVRPPNTFHLSLLCFVYHPPVHFRPYGVRPDRRNILEVPSPAALNPIITASPLVFSATATPIVSSIRTTPESVRDGLFVRYVASVDHCPTRHLVSVLTNITLECGPRFSYSSSSITSVPPRAFKSKHDIYESSVSGGISLSNQRENM